MFKTYDIALVTSQAMNADFNTPPWDITGIDLGSIELAWTSYSNAGTAATFKLQGSNAGVVWDDIPSTSVTVSGATGNQMYNVDRQGYKKIRLAYSHGSASAGTMTVVATNKSLLDNGIVGGTV